MLELLLVIILLGGAAVLFLGITPSLTHRQQSVLARHAVEDMLARAHLHAPSKNGCTVRFDEHSITLRSSDDENAKAVLPHGWTAEIVDLPDQDAMESLMFATDGTSSDAIIRLTHSGGHINLEYLGLSGQITRLLEAP